MATFHACNDSAKLPILNQCRVRMRRLSLLPAAVERCYRDKNSVALINCVINFCYQYICFEIFFSNFFFTKTPFFLYNYIAPSFLMQLCVKWIKIVNFARAITRIRMRPFQLKSGVKYRMLHGRKVDFTSCNFAALASIVQQILSSVKIAYFPPS